MATVRPAGHAFALVAFARVRPVGFVLAPTRPMVAGSSIFVSARPVVAASAAARAFAAPVPYAAFERVDYAAALGGTLLLHAHGVGPHRFLDVSDHAREQRLERFEVVVGEIR
jgi:hypothetical protein